MPRTASMGKIVYSVDMMIAYVNLFKLKHEMINLNDLDFDPDYKGWSIDKVRFSPNDVLENPKKYKEDYKRIIDADLSYPIIVSWNPKAKRYIIFDGYHRILKTKALAKKNIKAYVLDKKILNKFVIDKNGDWNVGYSISDYIEIFNKKF